MGSARAARSPCAADGPPPSPDSPPRRRTRPGRRRESGAHMLSASSYWTPPRLSRSSFPSHPRALVGLGATNGLAFRHVGSNIQRTRDATRVWSDGRQQRSAAFAPPRLVEAWNGMHTFVLSPRHGTLLTNDTPPHPQHTQDRTNLPKQCSASCSFWRPSRGPRPRPATRPPRRGTTAPSTVGASAIGK